MGVRTCDLLPKITQGKRKAESAVKIVRNLLCKASCDNNDPKAILHWRNTPTENMDRSLAQWLISRQLKTSIPVMNKLLEPVGVTERLAAKEAACQVTL